jgi:hypothetical protein
MGNVPDVDREIAKTYRFVERKLEQINKNYKITSAGSSDRYNDSEAIHNLKGFIIVPFASSWDEWLPSYSTFWLVKPTLH